MFRIKLYSIHVISQINHFGSKSTILWPYRPSRVSFVSTSVGMPTFRVHRTTQTYLVELGGFFLWPPTVYAMSNSFVISSPNRASSTCCCCRFCGCRSYAMVYYSFDRESIFCSRRLFLQTSKQCRRGFSNTNLVIQPPRAVFVFLSLSDADPARSFLPFSLT